ncbi:MAG: Transcription termination factor NusA [Parcubacteria group bacterium GW2011_GWB1_35_5]|nr:MAG: Transcription termination factor NusA [Parcubacteria group bacterium GW2011_GWC1_34_10]KKP81371.1 MAG: Transcription termination factor NusA [Parcubacteria group bacterium GW2011_GWB1_35_5]
MFLVLEIRLIRIIRNLFNIMFDLKVINSVLDQLEEERGIAKEKVIEAIEMALATAYKKEYGKRGQIVRANFDLKSGDVEMNQVKIVVDDTKVFMDKESLEDALEEAEKNDDERVLFNPEHHILLPNAQKIKKDAVVGDEIIFHLESKGDYGRIASQTAKQVIMQKIREAERSSVLKEFGEREDDIISGTVQRIERGNIFVDVGRAVGILSYEEQIPGERFNQGERVRAYLYKVEDGPKGVALRLSRSHPKFLVKLFENEAPELKNGTIEIKSVAREAGSRSKIAVASNDNYIDPVGSLVGQRGVRVATVTSELGGEKIDIIEWSEDPAEFIEDALSPAKIISVEINEKNKEAAVIVSEDQQSLTIGKGGQNVRLAAKLTGWRIDIKSTKGEELEVAE